MRVTYQASLGARSRVPLVTFCDSLSAWCGQDLYDSEEAGPAGISETPCFEVCVQHQEDPSWASQTGNFRHLNSTELQRFSRTSECEWTCVCTCALIQCSVWECGESYSALSSLCICPVPHGCECAQRQAIPGVYICAGEAPLHLSAANLATLTPLIWHTRQAGVCARPHLHNVFLRGEVLSALAHARLPGCRRPHARPQAHLAAGAWMHTPIVRLEQCYLVVHFPGLPSLLVIAGQLHDVNAAVRQQAECRPSRTLDLQPASVLIGGLCVFWTWFCRTAHSDIFSTVVTSKRCP